MAHAVEYCLFIHRLQLRVSGEGEMYSTRGEVKKKWRWGGGMEEEERGSMAFQPLSLPLNKNLLLQWSGRDQLVVTFSVGQNRVKLTIPCKLKEVEEWPYAVRELLTCFFHRVLFLRM